MHTTDIQPAILPVPLRNLYLRWVQACNLHPFPRLSQMQMHHLVAEIDALVLTEVVRAGNGKVVDFCILFITTKLRGNSTRSLMGKKLSELPGKAEGSRIWAAHMDCATLGVPLRASFPYVGPNPDFSCTCDVLLPLADNRDHDRDLSAFVLAGVVLRSSPPAGFH